MDIINFLNKAKLQFIIFNFISFLLILNDISLRYIFLIINHFLIIYYIFFLLKYPFWTIISQFTLYLFFLNIIPYIFNLDISITHSLIIYSLQLSIFWNYKKKFNHYKIDSIDNKTNYFIYFGVVIIYLIFFSINFKFLQYYAIIFSVLLVYLAMKSKFLYILNFLILSYFIINFGFLGGDRRFLVIFLFILVMNIYLCKKIHFSNSLFLISIPIIIIIFYIQGLYRNEIDVNRILLINIFDINHIKSVFLNIDVGQNLRVFENIFIKNQSILEFVRGHYITTFSFERFMTVFVPRSIFIEKPVVITRLLADLIYLKNKSNSLVATLPVEMYLNFGLITIFVNYFLIKGIYIFENVINKRNNLIFLNYLLILVLTPTLFRSSIETDLIIYLVLANIFFIIFYQITKKKNFKFEEFSNI